MSMEDAAKVPTPELDKQKAVIDSGRSDTVQEFYDWLREERGLTLCEPVPDSIRGYYQPTYIQPEQLMADFFGIDRDKIEAERRALLEAIRA